MKRLEIYVNIVVAFNIQQPLLKYSLEWFARK